MNQTIGPFPIGQVHNPNAAPGTPYGAALEAILNAEGFESARRATYSWPKAPTWKHGGSRLYGSISRTFGITAATPRSRATSCTATA